MDDDSWLPWIPYTLGEHQSPYSYEKVETRRKPDGPVVVVTVRDLHPHFNVADLWWRPIGEVKPPVNFQMGWASPQASSLDSLFGFKLW